MLSQAETSAQLRVANEDQREAAVSENYAKIHPVGLREGSVKPRPLRGVVRDLGLANELKS